MRFLRLNILTRAIGATKTVTFCKVRHRPGLLHPRRVVPWLAVATVQTEQQPLGHAAVSESWFQRESRYAQILGTGKLDDGSGQDGPPLQFVERAWREQSRHRDITDNRTGVENVRPQGGREAVGRADHNIGAVDLREIGRRFSTRCLAGQSPQPAVRRRVARADQDAALESGRQQGGAGASDVSCGPDDCQCQLPAVKVPLGE